MQGRSRDLPPLQLSVVVITAIVGIIGYGAYRNGNLRAETLVSLGVLVPAVVLHEVSHGWLANLFGDPTAKRAGRLTLNPLRHVDPVGTFILPGVLLLASGGANAFGYAKPVPVDVSHMSRNRSMFVGLVGPATNIVLALLTAGLIHLFVAHHGWIDRHAVYWIAYALLSFGQINVVLAVFNLIPIPPLDGASVVERFLPERYLPQYLQFRRYAMFLLLFLVLMQMNSAGPSVFQRLFDPALNAWADLLPHTRVRTSS